VGASEEGVTGDSEKRERVEGFAVGLNWGLMEGRRVGVREGRLVGRLEGDREGIRDDKGLLVE